MSAVGLLLNIHGWNGLLGRRVLLRYENGLVEWTPGRMQAMRWDEVAEIRHILENSYYTGSGVLPAEVDDRVATFVVNG